MRLFRVISLCLVLTCAAVHAQSPADSPATAAARKRQEVVKSVGVVFALHEVREKGSATYLLQGSGQPSKDPVPANQLVIDSADNKLVIEENRVRFDYFHPLLNVGSGQVLGQTTVAASNGSETKMFYTPPEGADRKRSGGVIGDSSNETVLGGIEFLPLKMAFRGAERTFGEYPITEFISTGAQFKIRGANCEEYTAAASLKATAYFDPARGMALTRFRLTSTSNAILTQLEVESMKEQSGVWVPEKWAVQKYDNAGKLTHTKTFSVQSVVFGEQHPVSYFEPAFPAGLEVFDTRTKESFLVREDGSMGKLARPGQDDAETQADLKSNWWSRNTWALTGGAVAVLGCCGVVVSRKLRRKA